MDLHMAVVAVLLVLMLRVRSGMRVLSARHAFPCSTWERNTNPFCVARKHHDNIVALERGWLRILRLFDEDTTINRGATKNSLSPF